MTDILLDFDGTIPRAIVRGNAWRNLRRGQSLHYTDQGAARRLRWVLDVAVCAKVKWLRVDRTRNGYHVVVRTNRRLAAVRVVLCQALLGSDWRRETFNARRVARLPFVPPYWRRRWNTLYAAHHRSVRI